MAVCVWVCKIVHKENTAKRSKETQSLGKYEVPSSGGIFRSCVGEESSDALDEHVHSSWLSEILVVPVGCLGELMWELS